MSKIYKTLVNYFDNSDITDEQNKYPLLTFSIIEQTGDAESFHATVEITGTRPAFIDYYKETRRENEVRWAVQALIPVN